MSLNKREMIIEEDDGEKAYIVLDAKEFRRFWVDDTAPYQAEEFVCYTREAWNQHTAETDAKLKLLAEQFPPWDDRQIQEAAYELGRVFINGQPSSERDANTVEI